MSTRTKIPFLTDRDGTLLFRRRVPDRYRDLAGFYEWKRALGRGSASNPRIRLELRLLTEATDEALALLERGQTVPTDLLERALEPLYPAQHSIQSLDDAIDAYVSDRGLPELRKAEAAAVAHLGPSFQIAACSTSLGQM
ncbi:hypothetical protein NHF45_14040 [Maricaulaceae bacterium NA33B04]|nr:hypothetical protein [Maricaulaceae bacterium NA33B04]